jgi:hypothetical protein
MMTVDGCGILNDWDHARKISDMANGPRQLSRSVCTLLFSNRRATIELFNNQGT